MNQPNDQNINSERGVLEIIAGINNGLFNPRSLTLDDRRQCVVHLHGEGVSIPQIAKLLKISDRTVRRDRKEILEAEALQPDPKLAGLYAGQLAIVCDTSISHLRSIARDKATPPSAKIDAERACVELCDLMLLRLQSMGFLPQATHRIEADLTHNLGNLGSLTDLKAEITYLESIESRVVCVDPKTTGDPPSTSPTPPNEGGPA